MNYKEFIVGIALLFSIGLYTLPSFLKAENTIPYTETSKFSYSDWKQALEYFWSKQPPEDRILDLIYRFDHDLSALRQNLNNSFYQGAVLVTYNFLRESLSFPLIHTLDQIDDTWINDCVYPLWKEEKKQIWEKQGIDTKKEQKNKLVTSLNHFLNSNNEPIGAHKRQALFNYNLLNELSEFPLGRTFLSTIDSDWLYDHVYVTWNDEIKQEWKKRKIESFACKIVDILIKIENALKEFRADSNNLFFKKRFLYCYNLLREMLHLDNAKTITEIDYPWIESIRKEALLNEFLEKYHYELAPDILENILTEAREAFHLDDSIVLAVRKGKGGTNAYGNGINFYIVLGLANEHNHQYKVFYHELGHIMLKHDKTPEMRNNTISLEEIDLLLSSDDFIQGREKISKFINIGKKAFTNKTRLGKTINSIVSSMLPLWVLPLNDYEYKKTTLAREYEQQADLFACDKLLKLGKLDPILATIELYALSNYITAYGNEDEHPSNFERALYMIGFLVDKGLDINQAFDEWYSKKDIQAHKPSIAFAASSKDAVNNEVFSKAQQIWQQDATTESFKQWKMHVEASWQREGLTTLYAQVNMLFSSIKHFYYIAQREMERVISKPADYELQALYNYNLLRELLGQSPAVSFAEINFLWMQETYYAAWYEYYNDTHITMLTIRELIKQLNFHLDEFEAQEVSSTLSNYHEQEALCCYNLLLDETAKSPHIWSLKQLDFKWIRQQESLYRESMSSLSKVYKIITKLGYWLGR